MQVTVEDISSVKKNLRVEIPREEVAREIDKAYDQLKKTARIKGFRPGKTPRSVLEKMFKKDVLADVSSRLIQSSFIDAIKEKDLRVVGAAETGTAGARRPQRLRLRRHRRGRPADRGFRFQGPRPETVQLPGERA